MTTLTKLSLAQVNLRSSPAAMMNLEESMTQFNYDVIAISEPTKRMRLSRTTTIGNYRWICSKHEEAWTGVLVKTGLDFELASPPSSKTVGIVMKSKKGPIGILSFYIKPDGWQEALDLLDKDISTMKTKTDKLFALGDSNGHSGLWSTVQINNEIGDCMEEIIASQGLCVLNDPASPPSFHDASGTGHWLDISLCSPGVAQMVSKWQVKEDLIPASDHQLIHIEAATELPRGEIRMTPNWRKVHWDHLAEVLDTKLTNAGLDSGLILESRNEIDSSIQALTAVIREAVAETVPMKRVCNFSNGWYDAEMRHLNNVLKNAKRIWRTSRSQDKKRDYLEAKAAFRNRSLEKKRESFYRFCDSLDNESMWDGLRRISGNRGILPIDYLMVEDSFVSSEADIASALANKYFGQDCNPTPSQEQEEAQREFLQWQADLEGQEEMRELFSTEEVCATLKSGRASSAPGLDEIGNMILKRMAAILAPPVSIIFNSAVQWGYFPTVFKTAQVLNVRKPGKDQTSPSGFRPISLLSCLGKKYESLLNSRFTAFMEDARLWDAAQFGFRRGKGVSQALWHLTHHIMEKMNKKSQTTAICFDFAGAFDQVDPFLLWKKMFNAGVPRHLLRPIAGFLFAREVNLQIRSSSFPFSVKRGLPQGSVLSPGLFLTYINDVISCSVGAVRVQLFADDIIIFREMGRTCQEADEIQATIDNLERWSHSNMLPFNVGKTRMTRFSHLTKAKAVEVRFCGLALTESENITYLGVTLDRKMLFQNHLRSVCQKALGRLQKIRMLASHNFGSAPDVLRKMFLNCVIPCLFYGAEAWGQRCSRQSFRQALNRILRLGGIAITGAFRSSPTEEVMHLAGLNDAALIASEKMLQFAFSLREENLLDNMPTQEKHLSSGGQLKAELRRMLIEGLGRPQDCNKRSEWKEKVKSYLRQRASSEWLNSQPCQGRSELNWGPYWHWPKWYFRKWKRKELSTVVQFLLNHWRCNQYLFRIGRSDSQSCRRCQALLDDRSHLFDCPAFFDKKCELWDAHFTFDELILSTGDSSFFDSLTKFLLYVSHHQN